MILEVRGSLGECKKTVRLANAFTAKNTIKLKYVHLPPLSLIPAFPNAVSIEQGELSDVYDIPKTPSYGALANELDKLVFDGNQRPLYAYYDGNAFEINTSGLTVNFSQEFASFLKMPQTVLPERTMDSNLDASHTHHFSHYEVVVKETKGTFDGISFDECVGRVRRDGKIISGDHHFAGIVTYLDVEVYEVDIGGGSELVRPTVDWAVGFELK